jgi:fructoselysine 6-kinase
VENRLLMPSSQVDIVAIGDNITDCFVDRRLMFPGGNAVNVAVAASRAGCRSAYVGVVGDDERGRLLRESLIAEQVDVRQLHVLHGATAYVTVRQVAGERLFERVDRGVSLLHPSSDDLAFASSAAIAHTTYCSGLEGSLSDLASRTRVSFDFDVHLADDYATSLIQYVWAAEFSAAGLSDEECQSLLSWAHASGVTHVFATRAEQGAMYFGGNDFVNVQASSLEPVDTLGAGDAFIGRALCGLLHDEDPARLLAASVAAASDVCQSLGGFGHASSFDISVVEPTENEPENLRLQPKELTHFPDTIEKES